MAVKSKNTHGKNLSYQTDDDSPKTIPVVALVGGNRTLDEDPGRVMDARSQDQIALGLVSGASILCGFGERPSPGTAAAGEDIWPGTATTVPTPADAGVGMSVVSSSANDGAGTDVGTRTLVIDYLDAAGNPQAETVTMNGTGAVDLVDRNVRFVQAIHSATVGDNGVAVGDITIHLTGDATTVYCQIAAGGNFSLTPHRMVPVGKTLILRSWHCAESKNKRIAFRLRATSHEGILYPGVFLFQDAMFLALTGLSAPVISIIPALAIVKVSGWAEVTGGEASCSWRGTLYDA